MVRLGTRGSLLARTQSTQVAEALYAATGLRAELVIIRSEGDDHRVPLHAPSRPGIFVATLRDALLAGEVDLVVHSFKDLPSAPMPGLVIPAIPARRSPADVLVTATGGGLADLAVGARVGTSSPRRAAALLRVRPDLTIVPIRGNVDTRVAAVAAGTVDAVVLAQAGLERLGHLTDRMTPLPTRVMLPAPAQGALAVECRAADPLADHLAVLDDPRARLEVTAERAVLTGVQATCTTAIGALARWESGVLTLRAELTEDGTRSHTHAEHSRTLADEHDLDGAAALGAQVAEWLLL